MTNTAPFTFPCPVCEQQVPLGATVCPNPNCKEDLTSLAVIDTVGQELFGLALRRVKEGKPEEALQYLLTATAYAPVDVDVWVVLGKLLAQFKRYDEAVRAWNRTLELQPEEQRATAGIQAVKRIQRQRRLSTWGMLLVGALVIFFCGVVGGRQSMNIFPASTEPPSQQAEIPSALIPSPSMEPSTALPTPSPVPSENATPTLVATETPVMCRITTGFADGRLYVRDGPGTFYQALGWVIEGDELTITESTDSPIWIRVLLPSGIEGYINSNFCK